jgi:serine/threonine protein kinase
MSVSAKDGALHTSRWSADELIPFGKYILLERISSGGTASVYRAKSRGEAGFERLVAVKRILPHMAGDPEFVKTFVREAKTAARLNHTNICPIYELGKVGESIYMAMECIQGKDLGKISRRLAKDGECMPPLIAAWVASKLCDALDYAHTIKNARGETAGIIHRDLSPANIVISYEGQVKLIDFGLAKAVGRAQQTNVDALKKKLGYMSPEMVKGRPLDARSDIFGVGVCLYEMVTGRRLFQGKDDLATLSAVTRASVPPPSALMEDTPEDLELIIMMALERDPEDRYQNAAEMGVALMRYVSMEDPLFSARYLAEWVAERFADDQASEQARINELLEASNNPEVLEERKRFFLSPDGAAAIARAEVERRLSTQPPGGMSIPPLPAFPAPAKLPLAPPAPGLGAQALSPGAFNSDDEPTGFYDAEPPRPSAPAGAFGGQSRPAPIAPGPASSSVPPLPGGKPGALKVPPLGAGKSTLLGMQPLPRPAAPKAPAVAAGKAAPPPQSAGGFDEEQPTGFYDAERRVSPVPPAPAATASDGGFAPEATEYLDGQNLEAVKLGEYPQDGFGFDEDATEIFFNKEDGTGVEALEEIGDSDRPLPAQLLGLSRPRVDPSAFQRNTPQPMPVPVQLPPQQAQRIARPTQRTQQIQLPPAQSSSNWMLFAGLLLLALAVAGLIARTPVGVALGLRKPRTGAIEVRTSPVVEAAVKLDEIFRGKAPLRLDGVRAGGHRLEVQATGYATVTRDIGLTGGTTAMVEVALVPLAPPAAPPVPVPAPGPTAAPGTAAVTSTGMLTVETVPATQLVIDGQDTGKQTPIADLPLPAGQHLIGMRTAKGDVHNETVLIKPGETVRLVRRYE